MTSCLTIVVTDDIECSFVEKQFHCLNDIQKWKSNFGSVIMVNKIDSSFLTNICVD